MKPQFKIGDWFVDIRDNSIGKGAEVRRLEPKVMAVLTALRNAHERPLTAEELTAMVWPDTHVSETLLRRAVSELRKALDDDAKQPRYIKTVPKVGYRLIAPVVSLASAEEPPQHQPAQSVSVPRSIQVAILMALAGWSFWLCLQWFTTPDQSTSDHQSFMGKISTPLTEMKGMEGAPALSPDGSQLAFVSRPNPDSKGRIFLQKTNRLVPAPVTAIGMDAFAPNWSGDGQRLFFIIQEENRYRIASVGIRPGNAFMNEEPTTHFHALGQLESFDLAPDGDWLVICERIDAGPSKLYRLDLDNQARTLLTRPPDRYLGDRRPICSPDGDTIAFLRTVTPDREDLFLIPNSGGEAIRITFLEAQLNGHAWRPDGFALVFSARRDGRTELLQVATGDAAVTPFLGSTSPLREPAFSRDGTVLVCQKLALSTDIYRLDLDTEPHRPRIIISTPHHNTAPHIAGNGRSITFMSTRAGTSEIWTVSTTGDDLAQLTSKGGPFTDRPTWSPDNNHIAFQSQAAGNNDIYVVAFASGQDRRLTFAEAEDRLPTWSPHGRFIYFTSNRADGWQIWKMSAHGGKAERITLAGGFRAMLSTDGAFLYYSKHQLEGLWRMPTVGGDEEWVLPLEQAQWGNWAVADGGIYYLATNETGTEIRFRDEFGREDNRVATLEAQPENPSLALSPDHTWLLYSEIKESDGNLVKFTHP